MAVRSVNIQINDVATPPPTISKEGNWLLYDGEKWVDTGIRAEGKDADQKEIEELKTGLTNANTLIATLNKAQAQLEQGLIDKTDTKDIQYLLDSLKNGKTQVAGGLVLTNNIILSDPNSKDVTAMISGSQTEGAKALRLGIAKNDTEMTALNNNGTGHIGELFFNGDYIGFGTEQQRYMTIGGVARTEQEMNEASTEITVYPIASAEVTTNRPKAILERYQSAESNRELKFEIPLKAYARCEAIPNNGNDNGGGVTSYSPNNAFVTVWAELEMRRNGVLTKTYKTAEVRASASVEGGSVGRDEPAPMPAGNRKSITGSIVVPASSVQRLDEWTLILKCKGSTIDSYSYARGSTVGGKSYIPYDNSQPLISITDSKAAFFYGRQKQVLLNYASEVLKVIGNAIFQGNLAIKGTVTADSIDTPGIPLCGAMVTNSGSVLKSFGRYKNDLGGSYPKASYSYSTKSFTVYHSIPHSRYIPLVNPFNDPASPVISDVSAYSFKVRFTLQQYRNDGWAVGFSYIAFKAE